MSAIKTCPLPPHALLKAYERDGMYADCYTTDIARHVAHAEYVEAFYSTGVFALERLVLKFFTGRPSTRADANALAEGRSETYAAWRVEGRADRQLLLADYTGRTRSWLMTQPVDGGGTRLYFGSAVVPRHDPGTGRSSLGPVFSALLGFHKLYSRVLLSAARSRLAKATAEPRATSGPNS